MGRRGGWLLINIGLLELLALAVLMESGRKGGAFFPMMFAGAAVGMGVRPDSSGYAHGGREDHDGGSNGRDAA